MSELAEKERIAIERLKAFEPDEPYHLCYSGGKDSEFGGTGEKRVNYILKQVQRNTELSERRFRCNQGGNRCQE